MRKKTVMIIAISIISIIYLAVWFFFYSYNKINAKYTKEIAIEKCFFNSIAINLFKLYPDYKNSRLFIFRYEMGNKKVNYLLKCITPFIKDKKFNKGTLLHIIGNLIEKEKGCTIKPNKELKEFYLLVDKHTDLLPEILKQLIMFYSAYSDDLKTLEEYYVKLDEYYKKESYKNMGDNDKMFMAMLSVALNKHQNCDKFLQMIKRRDFTYYLLATIITLKNDKAKKSYFNHAIKLNKDLSRIIYYYDPELNKEGIDINSIYRSVVGPELNIQHKKTKFEVIKIDNEIKEAFIGEAEYIFQVVLQAVLQEKYKSGKHAGKHKVISLTYSADMPVKNVEAWVESRTETNK